MNQNQTAEIDRNREIDNILTEDATAIMKHFMPLHCSMNLKDSHLKSLARDLLRSKKMGVLDALILIEKEKSSQPKTKAF